MYIPLLKPILRTIGRLLSFALYAATLIAAFGGRVSPEISTFPSVMVLTLPYLAIATLLVSVAWICTCRFFTGGLGLLTIFIAISPITTACPISFSKNPDPDADTFTLMSYNMVNGTDQQHIGNQTGCRALQYVLHSGADIVCLQEARQWKDPHMTNLTPALRDSLFAAYPYHAFLNEELDTKVLSKYPMRPIPGDTYIHEKYDRMRYTFWEVDIKGHKVTLVNMHFRSPGLDSKEKTVVKEMASMKNTKSTMEEMKGSIYTKLGLSFKSRKHDAEILRRALDEIEGDLIVCGDFNDVPESFAYRLLRGEDLRDAYAETGFGPMITYNLHAFWFHLDQIFYRGDLKALSVKKGKIKASDHYPLTAEFEFTPEKK